MPISSFSSANSIMKPGVCTSTTRPASPYDGQVIYETDTDRVAVYDSSAWVYKTNAGAPALTLITAQTIGSAVSSVTVSNVFSATYDNYRIIISGGAASANVSLLWTMGATTTGYYSALNGRSWANAAVTSTSANGANWSCGEATTNQINTVVDLFAPFLSDETSFVSLQNANVTTGYTYQAGGYLANTTSYTSFTVAPTSGTLTGGTIRVYGYQNS